MNNEEFDLIVHYDKNWYNNIETYNRLNQLYYQLSETTNLKVLLDFNNCQFISANILAIFGGILSELVNRNGHYISVCNIQTNIRKVMQMNGFRKHFNWEGLEDTYKSTIEYKCFQATTENIEEFEKYILINVFERDRMPSMSTSVRDSMIDNFLEMFNNVIDHAETNRVYVCGQYFYKKGNLVLTIVDFGKTIRENVCEFLKSRDIDNALEWAVVAGNSTKVSSAPGGLGFSLILEFIKLNRGEFSLVSDNECYEITAHGKKRFTKIDKKFPGTIVTITFNLQDDFSYILKEEKENIIF